MVSPVLRAPDGFEWVPDEPALRCAKCGYVVSAFAPQSVEREQQMYDAWAEEHRRKGCPST